MDENDNEIVVTYQVPSIKDQFVTNAIALGVGLAVQAAVVGAVIGSVAVYRGTKTLINKIKSRKTPQE